MRAWRRPVPAIGVALLLALPTAADAQVADSSRGQLCSFISGRSPERDPAMPTDYAYQTSIYRAAGVDADADATGEIRRKIQAWWARGGRHHLCNAINFNVPNGSVIKYAVSRRFDGFIADFAAWGLNLNLVDPTDNRTVLDYIEDEIVRLQGTSAERILRRYYRTFRDAGALHRRELREVVYTETAPGQ